MSGDNGTRRDLLKKGAAVGALAATGCGSDAVNAFIHQNLTAMSAADVRDYVTALEAKYNREFGRDDVTVTDTPAMPGVVFGHGLDLSRCNGNRRCVEACVEENNQSRADPGGARDAPVEWITVLEMDKEHGIDLDHATAYFDAESVPQPGKFYFPVACQQCENPPCVKVCPVKATWSEPDGIVVIDYDQCIGCRCCMSACPYGARRFNWAKPNLPADELNPKMHVLGNRPRPRGVVEKCTFCIQRTRQGRYPACHDVCPTGARVFGNLLDPQSEIRQLLDRKRVYIFKNDLNTRPRFFYFYG